MKVSELGEFGLIERLTELLAGRGNAAIADRLAVSIGDDAAVWRSDSGALIATTDTLVAGVHFLLERQHWRDAGWKALAVNVSDVAAMGGTPSFVLITLGLKQDQDAEEIDQLYEGLADAADALDVVIAGGDIVRAQAPFVSVALIGEANVDASGEPVVLRRNAARAGDILAVTGTLGGSAGGLQLLRSGGVEAEAARLLIERHLRPKPRVAAGRAALAAGVRCAIDISDGLMQDLGHICRMSRAGAVVWKDKLPLDPVLTELLGAEEALRYAAGGGEDYELLFAGEQQQIDMLARDAGVPVTIIGEMVIDAKCEATLLDEAGRTVPVTTAGWDHLRG